MAEVLRDDAAQLEVPPEALSQALNMLQLSLESTLVLMSKRFETERQRTDEELARREEELGFLATHDALTGLPNRTLILDRAEQMLARCARSQTAGRGAVRRSRQLQGGSTTPWDTQPAISSFKRSRRGSMAWYAAPMRWDASAATSSS